MTLISRQAESGACAPEPPVWSYVQIRHPLQFSSNLYLLYSEFPHCDSGNVYLITGRQPVLIDCGSRRAVPSILRGLESLGVELSDIERVLGTHGDCDHVQGFHDLNSMHPGLRLSLHTADWPLVQEPDAYRNASYLYGTAVSPISAESCEPLADGQGIAAGDGELTVVHTPGHTEGSVCLHGEIDGRMVLFAGDTIGGSMRSLDGADPVVWMQAIRTWEASLERLAGLPIDWILNGHEPASGLPLARPWFDRAITSFGKMMNPWFHLSEPPQEADAYASSSPSSSGAGSVPLDSR